MDTRHEIDRTHAAYLRHYKEYAAGFFAVSCGEGRAMARVLHYDTDEATDLSVLSEVWLPRGWENIPVMMARFCHYRPLVSQFYLDRGVLAPIPYMTFSLPHLLDAAYPKDARTGAFRSTTAGELAGMDWRAMKDDTIVHAVFAGLGVFLMDVCREVLDPFATDADLIDAARGMFLAVADRDCVNLPK